MKKNSKINQSPLKKSTRKNNNLFYHGLFLWINDYFLRTFLLIETKTFFQIFFMVTLIDVTDLTQSNGECFEIIEIIEIIFKT